VIFAKRIIVMDRKRQIHLENQCLAQVDTHLILLEIFWSLSWLEGQLSEMIHLKQSFFSALAFIKSFED
jgi:hypothetical protein